MKLVKGKQAYSFRAINTNHTNTSLLELILPKSYGLVQIRRICTNQTVKTKVLLL